MPRTLTEPQKAAITQALGSPSAVEIIHDTTIEDAQAYADEIAQVFADAGWTVQRTTYAAWGASPSGLLFMSEGDLPLRPVGADLIAAFQAAEVEYNQMDAMLPEGVDVKLLVGRVGV